MTFPQHIAEALNLIDQETHDDAPALVQAWLAKHEGRTPQLVLPLGESIS